MRAESLFEFAENSVTRFRRSTVVKLDSETGEITCMEEFMSMLNLE